MKYFLLLSILFTVLCAKSQDGKIIEQVRIPAIADSFMSRSNPFFDSVQHIFSRIEVYRITYLSDGLKIKGYMDIPKAPGKYPCIIYNRGGNRNQGKLKEGNYLGDMAQMANWGYCVIGSQYRGNDGGEGADEFAGKDINDVMNLLPLLNNIEKADTSRIGMWGMSRGGLMTYLALTKTNRIKAAITISGLADLKQGVETQAGADSMFYKWLPEYRTNKEEFLKNRSALNAAGEICKTTPIFIIQGSGDASVTTPQVFALVEKLYALKQPFRFELFEGGGHGVHEYEDEVDIQTKKFFDDYLRDNKKWPGLELHR